MHDVPRRERPVPLVQMDGVGEITVLQDGGLRLDEAAGAAIDGAQTLAQRPHGFPLHAEVEGGVDPEAALVDALATVFPFEVLADLLQEVRGDRGRVSTDMQPQGEAFRGHRLLGGHVLLLGHAIEDVVAALLRAVRVLDGGEAALIDLPKRNWLVASTP